MEVDYSPQYKKAYKKLRGKNKEFADKAMAAFLKNPFDPKLKNHALKGSLSGIRSISAAYDLRILYQERGRHAFVLMLKIGKHDEVY
jgi:addiction module RelE/StbE family toxin